ncbi:uncharacterized protein LOC100186120 [Ciona intestinalis]
MAKRNFNRCIKCSLAVLVLVLWVLSGSVLVLSTYVREDLSQLVLVTEDTSIGDFYLSIFFPVIFPVLVTISCFAFVIGCVGCSGAFTESQLMLGWFFFSMLVAFCVELSAGIWRMVNFKLSYNESDIDQLKLNIQRYARLEANNWFMKAWAKVHKEYECCGVDSFQDWMNSEPLMLGSCCPTSLSGDRSSSGGRDACLDFISELDGCGSKLLTDLSSPKSLASMPYITALLGITQVVALILALKLWLSYCFEAKADTTSSVSEESPTYEMGYVWDAEKQTLVHFNSANKQISESASLCLNSKKPNNTEDIPSTSSKRTQNNVDVHTIETNTHRCCEACMLIRDRENYPVGVRYYSVPQKTEVYTEHYTMPLTRHWHDQRCDNAFETSEEQSSCNEEETVMYNQVRTDDVVSTHSYDKPSKNTSRERLTVHAHVTTSGETPSSQFSGRYEVHERQNIEIKVAETNTRFTKQQTDSRPTVSHEAEIVRNTQNLKTDRNSDLPVPFNSPRTSGHTEEVERDSSYVT